MATYYSFAEKITDSLHIKRFAEVDTHLYRGAQPDSAGYLALKKLGIKKIINFRAEKNLIEEERHEVEALGIEYISIPWTIFSPYDQKVFDAFFEEIKNKDTHPVFFHCKRGSERTGVIAGAYKMKFQKMPFKDVLSAAKKFDLKLIWIAFVKSKLKAFERTLLRKQ